MNGKMGKVLVAFAVLLAVSVRGEVVTWPAAPDTAAMNGSFTVTVNGNPVDVVEIPKPTDFLSGTDAHPYYAVFFDADEEVRVKVSGAGDMRRAKILPMRLGIHPEVIDEHALSFRAKPPFNIVLEPTGRHRALVIAANTPERDALRPDAPGVVYFGPGRHVCDKPIALGSGQTLYLAPGAYVEGQIRANGDGITVCGRGILSGLPWGRKNGPPGWWCELMGKNITVRDISIMSTKTWALVFDGAEDVLVDNVKILNGRQLNDDGIDICSSRRVTIRNSFIRTQDDCIAPKFWCEDLLVEDCVLWTDVANIIRIGYECEGHDYPFRRHRYRGIDVLHQAIRNNRNPDENGTENTICIQATNDAVFEDMVFEDFRFAAPQPQDLFLCMRTGIIRFWGRDVTQGGHVRGITFRDIRIPANRPLGSCGIWIHSIDPEHIIEDVAFENIGGQNEFHVPVGIRGPLKEIKGLPCSINGAATRP